MNWWTELWKSPEQRRHEEIMATLSEIQAIMQQIKDAIAAKAGGLSPADAEAIKTGLTEILAELG